MVTRDDEAIPRCPVFGKCGGCQLQNLTYPVQLAFKAAELRRILSQTLDVSGVEILPIVPATSPWNYRRRVQLHRNPEGEIGFFSEATHELVAIDHCDIAHPAINETIASLRKSAAPQTDQRISLVWDERHQAVHQYGEDAEAAFFTQVNPEQNEILRKLLLEWVVPRKGMAVLELYAGGGNFTIPLAERGAQVTAIEASPQAVTFGARQGKSLSITWMQMGVRQALKQLSSAGKTWELCLLDPPRAGLKDSAAVLTQLSVGRILYVSCNPVALAKDLKVLIAGGTYRLTRIQPIDFFPQTAHVEVLCELEHLKRERHPKRQSKPLTKAFGSGIF